MKIEKISDSQIRITLTGEDLAARHLKLSELAYGSEKARKLFQDMMQEANYQFGFEADNIPLMIEAIPLAGGSIVLIVTKVDNPEELDSRFSSFSPSVQAVPGASEGTQTSALEQLISSIRKEYTQEAVSAPAGSHAPGQAENKRREYAKLREYYLLHRLYSFRSVNDATRAAADAAGFTGESSLYYSEQDQTYYLSLSMKDVDEMGEMQRILSVISEFGTLVPAAYAREQYLKEHCKTVIADHALQPLSALN